MNTNGKHFKEFRYFTLIGGIFVAALLISNIAAQKLFIMGPFTFTAGILLFPLTYIFGDVLTEVYGYARSRQIIWAGFFGNVLMVGFLWIAAALPPAPGWPGQDAFASVLAFLPRIALASIVAYAVGEFSNSYVLAKMKVWTSGKKLWLRTIGSTVVGQGIDTALFVLIAFYGVFPNELIAATIVSGYLFKVAYEVVATPLTYAVVNFLKKAEGIDVYDKDTNFSPFVIKLEAAEEETA